MKKIDHPEKVLRKAGWKEDETLPGFWIKPESPMADPVPLEEAVKIYQVWEECDVT